MQIVEQVLLILFPVKLNLQGALLFGASYFHLSVQIFAHSQLRFLKIAVLRFGRRRLLLLLVVPLGQVLQLPDRGALLGFLGRQAHVLLPLEAEQRAGVACGDLPFFQHLLDVLRQV